MSDDMKAITTLLGNLIERVENIEKGIAKTNATLVRQEANTDLQNEKNRKFDNNLVVSHNELVEFAKKSDVTNRNLASAMTALKLSVENREPDYGTVSRHAELDHWTKDLSTKLSIMQGEIDKIKIATKRRGSFFS